MAGGNPYLQDVSPDVTPPPVTPAASDPTRPPAPMDFSGIAPYDIAAPQDIGGIAGACSAAEALGERYMDEGRQFFDHPAGAGAFDLTSGFSPDSDTPNDVSPPEGYETPIQGHGYHPGTTQEGVQTYSGDSGSMEGLTPESGSMSSPGGNYPGTLQSGLPTYGK